MKFAILMSLIFLSLSTSLAESKDGYEKAKIAVARATALLPGPVAQCTSDMASEGCNPTDFKPSEHVSLDLSGRVVR